MVVVKWEVWEREAFHELVFVRVPHCLGEGRARVALLPHELVGGAGVLQQQEDGVRVATAVPVGDGHWGGGGHCSKEGAAIEARGKKRSLVGRQKWPA